MDKAARKAYRKKNNLSVREYRALKNSPNSQLQINPNHPRHASANQNLKQLNDYESALDNFRTSMSNDRRAADSLNNQRLDDFRSAEATRANVISGSMIAPPRSAPFPRPPVSGPPKTKSNTLTKKKRTKSTLGGMY